MHAREYISHDHDITIHPAKHCYLMVTSIGEAAGGKCGCRSMSITYGFVPHLYHLPPVKPWKDRRCQTSVCPAEKWADKKFRVSWRTGS